MTSQEFTGELWYWRGPPPHYFVTVPEVMCLDLKEESKYVSYGWGMIPVRVRIGDSEWNTSLFPKDGRYIVPVKAEVRKQQHLEDGAPVTVSMTVGRG